MNTVLISIKPKYVQKILTGEKIFEFRRKIWKKIEMNRALIYSSSPVQRVVAEFKIGRIYNFPLEILWDKCKEGSGITKSFYSDYYKGLETGYAIEICDLIRYERPKRLPMTPPMNFRYLDEDQLKRILS